MTSTQPQDEWLTRKEAAAYTRTTTGTLASFAYQHTRDRKCTSPAPARFYTSDPIWMHG